MPQATALIADTVVEAGFDDGTRLVVVVDPFGLGGASSARTGSSPAEVVAAERPRRGQS